MNDFCNPTPIATPEQYRAAILAVRQRMTDLQLAMLQTHCRAEEHSISTNRLAELLKLPTAGSANTMYRNYAHWIADELKFVPTNLKHKHCWWLALAYGREDGDVDGDYEWIMRPELVETLKAMRWA
ncbi:MAG: hypothetical protein HYX68_23245 [Planctomycetes bacterium]|nr:hypothetical protein [Planctomycetota bacterium]